LRKARVLLRRPEQGSETEEDSLESFPHEHDASEVSSAPGITIYFIQRLDGRETGSKRNGRRVQTERRFQESVSGRESGTIREFFQDAQTLKPSGRHEDQMSKRWLRSGVELRTQESRLLADEVTHCFKEMTSAGTLNLAHWK